VFLGFLWVSVENIVKKLTKSDSSDFVNIQGQETSQIINIKHNIRSNIC
jgi:hypothetical protein